MSDRIQKLESSIQKDEEKILALQESVKKLQEGIKGKKEKIRELHNTQLMNNLNAITAQGLHTDEIVLAIKNRDMDALFALLEENQPEKSGTSSAFDTTKED